MAFPDWFLKPDPGDHATPKSDQVHNEMGKGRPAKVKTKATSHPTYS